MLLGVELQRRQKLRDGLAMPCSSSSRVLMLCCVPGGRRLLNSAMQHSLATIRLHAAQVWLVPAPHGCCIAMAACYQSLAVCHCCEAGHDCSPMLLSVPAAGRVPSVPRWVPPCGHRADCSPLHSWPVCGHCWHHLRKGFPGSDEAPWLCWAASFPWQFFGTQVGADLQMPVSPCDSLCCCLRDCSSLPVSAQYKSQGHLLYWQILTPARQQQSSQILLHCTVLRCMLQSSRRHWRLSGPWQGVAWQEDAGEDGWCPAHCAERLGLQGQ